MCLSNNLAVKFIILEQLGVFLEYNFRGGKSTFLEIEGVLITFIKSKISGVKLFSGGQDYFQGGGGGKCLPKRP